MDIFAAIYFLRIALSRESRENKLLAKINWFTVLVKSCECV